MTLLELHIQNFISFGPVQKVKLAGQGLVLIEGENKDDDTVESNGSGKSTIFEALLWCLFGKTLRGLSADAVVSKKKGKDCRVTLLMQTEDGTACSVMRTRRDSEHKNYLRLLVGDKDMTCSDSSATQEEINKLLGTTYETFVNSVVFGQGVMKHFASMTDKEQKSIMDKLIGVEGISAAFLKAKEETKRITAELESLDIEESQAALERESADLEGLLEASAAWEGKNKTAIHEAKRELADAEAATVFAVVDPTVYQEAKLKVLQARAAAATAVARNLDAASALRTAGVRYNKAQKGGADCEYCGGQVSAAHYESHLEECKVEFQKADMLQGETSKAVEEANAAVRAASKVVEAFDEEIEEYEEGRVAREVKIGTLKNRLEDLTKASNPYEAQIAKAKARVEELTVALRLDKAKAAVIKGDLEVATFVQAMFSDKGGEAPPLKGCLLDNVVPFLNNKVSEYCSMLTGNAVAVEFSSRRELKNEESRDEFSVNVTNALGTTSYEAASGGEKRKIDVCIALALQALSAARGKSGINVAFYDEVFEGLDDAAVDKVMELLIAEQKGKDSLFVITHLSSLKSQFPRRIRVVKKDGVSRIC